jgi:transposase
MKLHVIGIDLGKTVFHLVGLDSTGRAVIRKKCSRKQLLAFTANLEVELIGMESCMWIALSRAGSARTGSRSAIDAGAVREALCADQEERLPGCGSHC